MALLTQRAFLAKAAALAAIVLAGVFAAPATLHASDDVPAAQERTEEQAPEQSSPATADAPMLLASDMPPDAKPDPIKATPKPNREPPPPRVTDSALAAAGASRLSDEELTLLRKWIPELARREDRRLRGVSLPNETRTGEDPFADEPENAKHPADDKADKGDANNQSGEGSPATKGDGEKPAANGAAAAAKPAFDPAAVSAGQSAFQSACTTCHDAERSTNVRKSLAGWVSTVRRMAAKDGADVSSGDVQPIATYLASLNPAGASGDTAMSAGADSSYSLFSTVSLIHLSGTREEIENQGFFPEVWLGAEWHPSGPLSARVNACVTCHTEAASVSSRIELAEGFFRLDVKKLLCCESCDKGVDLHIDAGRFIVPFGAFASQSHPGAFRTATRPLMYNMGQNVYRDELPSPLLPMPYADEGLLAAATLPLADNLNATFDFYAVNGLQGSTGIDLPAWYQSRDYVDNNTEPAVGGRATLGNNTLRAGASIMSGRFNDNSLFAAVPESLDYKIYGADITARYRDLLRVQVEYARRDNDAFDFNAFAVDREAVKGTVIEGEVKLWDCPKISAVVRYDDQRRTDGPLVQGPRLSAEKISVQRFTYGLNFVLGSSTLMVNHERWHVPEPLNDVDVLAIRWVATF